ncbi:AsmA-like C-terminal region-containing protein [Rhizobium sp. AAP43]|uniref:AsmA family protein n=1 Tax=Rhizobium sp. AAP43 TaxID=1523420 RepID=UPI0006B9BD28|nr:AsmA-like C-terminal region-containing protein [Rhizobium sp. AAP43]KPF41602.1 hypothetical protein IP76_20345 [Rhizobium sp. AAP43]
MLRLVLVLATIGLVSFIALRVAAPYMISSTVVRSALASSISRWTGHDVFISSISEVSFWPEPQVTLVGVTVSRGTGSDRQVLGEIDALEASFSFFSALSGQPDFTEFRFQRPRIRIERNAEGRLDWTNEGLLSEAVRAVKPSADGGQALPASNDARVGTVDVTDGEVTIVDLRDGTETVLSAVNATLEWPRLATPLSGTASMTLRGQDLNLDFDSPAPLLLIKGDEAPVRLQASLAAASLKLDGAMSLSGGLSGQNSVQIDVSDVSALARVLGMRLAGTEGWNRFSLTATIQEDAGEWRFETLGFRVNDSEGTGLIAMQPVANGRSRLSGTLAIDDLELDDLLEALAVPIGDAVVVRLPSILRWLDLDIRISAARATFAPFTLADVGASLIGREDEIALVIGDARLFGGTLSARINARPGAEDAGGNLVLMIDDARFGELFEGLGLTGPYPTGTGSIDLHLTLPPGDWRRKPDAISGKLRMSATDGTLRHFDADGLRRLATDRAYFQLDTAGDGGLDFDRLDLTARIANGVAELDEAQLSGQDESLQLSGIVPLGPLALALTGELTAVASPSEALTAPLRFFLGGTIQTPVISPIQAPKPTAGP